ncbi:GLE1-domain-containing protein [Choiromyces venosus 120613-1]|uniref:mRNA export factor GLE1 n=1 Tax=Choiromyces venosus 120613-1 TaxID=1336337 RepID=A0A3N4K5K0_9PEZI|nr:GLE1-domain-containing protein [Choiromyces venosus 120613-1]
MPLPDSDSEGEWEEGNSGADLFAHSSDIYSSSPGRTTSPRGSQSTCAARAQNLAEKINALDLKATEYSLASKLISTDNRANQEFTLVYLQDTRFDAHEAAILEERFQAKVRRVYEAKRQDDLNKARIEQEHREKLARQAEEAARRAQEIARQHEMERQKRELEKREQEQRAAEAARLKAERERAEEEKKRQAEEEKEAALKRQKDAEEARVKAERDASERAIREAAAAREAASRPGPEVYGRKSTTNEGGAMQRVIAALHELRHTVRQQEAFTKAKKLTTIRRGLRPKFGQLNGERAQTIEVRDFLKNTFVDLRQDPDGPTVPANTFFLTQDPSCNVPVPVAFIWTVNELAKLLVMQVISECAMKPGTADPIGVAVISTFADERLLVNGHSFIDIVIARLLKKNPILTGELGPEATEGDRKRLGWIQEEDGTWESEENHVNRMVGLAAGFTAIAGRNFGNSKMVNPYPIFNLWYAVAIVLNAPAEKLTNTHYFVMKTFLEVGARKLVDVYGHQAKKLVELAVGDWALRGEAQGFAGAVSVKAFGKFLRNEEWWKKS